MCPARPRGSAPSSECSLHGRFPRDIVKLAANGLSTLRRSDEGGVYPPANLQHITEPERAQVHRNAWSNIWNAHAVVKRKLWSPIHVNVIARFPETTFRICRHEHQRFLHDQIDFETRPVLRRIHEGDIHKAGGNMVDQILRHIDMDAKSDVAE